MAYTIKVIQHRFSLFGPESGIKWLLSTGIGIYFAPGYAKERKKKSGFFWGNLED